MDNSKLNLEGYGLKADKKLYGFIERIQHKSDGEGNRRIVWIECFNMIDDILTQINYKWKLDLRVDK